MSPRPERSSNLHRIRAVHRDILQHALHMRCVAYLADVKAQLLIQTVSSVGASKRLVASRNDSLTQLLDRIRSENEARMRVERQLREITDAVEHAPVMIVIARAGHIVYANTTFRDRFADIPLEGPLSEIIRAIAPEADLDLSDDALPLRHELEVHTQPNEEPQHLRLVMAVGHHGDAPPHHVAVLEDVTMERRAARRLERAQRLDALGKLVGGIAHDFNNLLMILSANIELLSMLQDDERDELIAQTLDSIMHGGELTRQLLAFAGRQVLASERLALVPLVTEVVTMLRRTVGEDHPIDLVVTDAPATVRSDRGQVTAALVNLIINARDASPSGSPIEVEIDRYHNPSPRPCGPGELPAGSFAALSVRDSGCGIAPGVADRLWEPFVSSKEQGEHSGLGLAMVAGFTQQSGGGIELTTAKTAEGTRMTIYLPTDD